MPVVSRGVVYSLIAVVFVLLLGITALLSVSYHRHQRLEDATIDFQRNLTQQESKIVELQTKLANCDTIQATPPTDTSWGTSAATDSVQVIKKTTPPKW
ncbi:hypothetical protein GCM10028808_64880 [Spirosoma migulaei]